MRRVLICSTSKKSEQHRALLGNRPGRRSLRRSPADRSASGKTSDIFKENHAGTGSEHIDMWADDIVCMARAGEQQLVPALGDTSLRGFRERGLPGGSFITPRLNAAVVPVTNIESAGLYDKIGDSCGPELRLKLDSRGTNMHNHKP